MEKVYVVTSGSYSDYRIRGCFDNKKSAETFIDALKEIPYYDVMYIEEYELNPLEDVIKSGRRPYKVSMRKDGTVNYIDITSDDRESNTITFDKTTIVVTCFATDKKHAIKIANEKRAEAIANNLL